MKHAAKDDEGERDSAAKGASSTHAEKIVRRKIVRKLGGKKALKWRRGHSD